MTQAALLYRNENYPAAAILYEKLLSIRPNSSSSYVNLAIIQTKMNKFGEAILTLQQRIKRIPGSEILLIRLGHTYLALERLNEAFSTMDLVLKIKAQNFDALLVSGLILDRQGRKEEAQSFFEKALAI